jgi:hypothetical protein
MPVENAPSPCVKPDDDLSSWTDVTFTQGVLPRRVYSSLGSGLLEGEASKSFLEYLNTPMLKLRRQQRATCRDSWGYAVSGCIQYATELAYARKGFRFKNYIMSEDFLLTCYEDGPRSMCGCFGADLPSVFKNVSRSGMVTAQQFPYISATDLSFWRELGSETVYYCDRLDYHGTCRPCQNTLQDYTETVLRASPNEGGFRFHVPCLPCSQPLVPRYYPKNPFHVYPGDDATTEEKAAAIRVELIRTGPLCAAITVDVEALSTLRSGGNPPIVSSVDDGIFYNPIAARAEANGSLLISALIVGYAEDRLANGTPFWICRTFVGENRVGYTLRIGERLVDNLFNVYMYDESSKLLDHVVSFDSVDIVTSLHREPGELGADDPFLEPLVSKIGFSPSISNSSANDFSAQDLHPVVGDREEASSSKKKRLHLLLFSILAVLVASLLWATLVL